MKFFKHLFTVIKHKHYVFLNACKLHIPFLGFKHDLSKFHPTEFFRSVKYFAGDKFNLDDNESPFSLYDITTQESPIQISKISVGSDENEAQTMENAFVTTKTFTAEEINEAVKSPQYVVTWQMKLTVDSNNITNEDLANYKVEATYLPYEGEIPPTSDSESTLKDYFIFTIAKLKTDF